MKVKDNAQVTINYTLKNDNGEVLDSSEGREPLVFNAGKGEIIPGLEQALMGKCKDEHVEVTIAPEDAYGLRQEDAVQQVPREQLAAIPNLQAGMPLQAETPQGTVTVFVAEVGDEMVTIDGNHPLAGETLHFSVDIVAVLEDEGGSPKIVIP